MKKMEIRTSDFTRSGDDKLTVFAQTVITNMAGKARYASVSTAFDSFKRVADDFDAKLLAAKGKASKDVTDKNNLKAELKAQLLTLCTVMEANHDGEESYFIEAGFNLRKVAKSKTVDNSPMTSTANVRIYSKGEIGVLHVDFDKPKDKRFLCMQLSYSIDNGVTWVNENFFSEPENVVGNLPSRIDLMFKTRNIGKRNKVSQWSEVVVTSAR